MHAHLVVPQQMLCAVLKTPSPLCTNIIFFEHRWIKQRNRRQVGPKDASRPMYSGGNTQLERAKVGPASGPTWWLSRERTCAPRPRNLKRRPSRPSRGRWSHFHAPLHIFYRESLRKYTGWCTNDFPAHGYRGRGRAGPRGTAARPNENRTGLAQIARHGPVF